MKNAATYGKPTLGCYFDHANYSNEGLSQRICALAIGYGWQPYRADVAILEKDLRDMSDEEFEELNEISEKAIDWLNEQETRSYMYWANEGEANAFGLWPNVESAKEDVGFVSTAKQDYPADDYEGEWLHVSDHGNATLYVRDASGKDLEIWSVV